MDNIFTIVGTIIVIGVGMTMYFIPAIIASVRNHRNQGTILFLNLVLGWTFFIWIALILWAIIERREPEREKLVEKGYAPWPTAEEETLSREDFMTDERKGYMS